MKIMSRKRRTKSSSDVSRSILAHSKYPRRSNFLLCVVFSGKESQVEALKAIKSNVNCTGRCKRVSTISSLFNLLR